MMRSINTFHPHGVLCSILGEHYCGMSNVAAFLNGIDRDCQASLSDTIVFVHVQVKIFTPKLERDLYME
jgi:hypothetical protein